MAEVVALAAPPAPVVPVDVAVPAGADPSAALLQVLLSGPLTVSALAGVALPLVTGLITGRSWPPEVKGLMLAVLSFASAAVAELVARESTGREVDWRTVLTAALVTWITAQVAHQGVWRHTGLSQVLQRFTLLPTPAPPTDPDASPWGPPGDATLGGRSVAATIRRVNAERAQPDPPRDGRTLRPPMPARAAPTRLPRPPREPTLERRRPPREGPDTLDDR